MRKQRLFSSGFVRYINIIDEKILQILPTEASKVLKKVVKEYPYSLITYVLAVGEFYLLRICSEFPDPITFSHEDLEDVAETWSKCEISRQWAFTIEDISLQLSGEKGEAWYTVYYSPNMLIQASEVIGSGTVEKLKKGHAPLQIVLPSSLEEVTAIGLFTPQILEAAQKIAPADSTSGPFTFERQPSSLTDRPSTANSDCSTELIEKTKGEDNI